jgi:SpoIID/LytB domain protein
MKNLSLLFLFLLSFSFFISAQKPNIDSYLNLAVVFKEYMEYGKVIEILESIPKRERNLEVKKFLGKLYYLKGEDLVALKIFKKIRKKDWFVYLYLGLIYEELKNYKEAIENYLISLRLKKTSIVLFRLGKIYLLLKDYKKAINCFLQGISLDPSIRLFNYYLGKVYLEKKDFKNAYRYFFKAKDFYPKKEIEKNLMFVKNKLGKNYFLKIKKEKEKKRKRLKLPYYKKEKGILVKVMIAKSKKFTLRCPDNFIIKDSQERTFLGKANEFYTFVLKERKVSLLGYKQKTIYESFVPPLEIKTKNTPFYIHNLIYGKGNFWQQKEDFAYRGDLRIIVKENNMLLVNILSLEEYLYGVIPSEISPFLDFEVLKAQAVVSRTIAFRYLGRHKKEGFDFCADVHCQVYKGFLAEKRETNLAVKETKGEVIFYKDKPIEAFYHSNCGGCIRGDLFGEKKYLVDKLDTKDRFKNPKDFSPYEEEVWFFSSPNMFCNTEGADFRWQRVYDKEDFYFVFGFPIRDIKKIVTLKKGACFHYEKIKLQTSGKTFILDGDLKIRNFFDKLRSSAFKVEIKYSSEGVPKKIFFWGAGFGHGVGFCQKGAIKMAEDGFNYKEIISHYYPYTKIKKIY